MRWCGVGCWLVIRGDDRLGGEHRLRRGRREVTGGDQVNIRSIASRGNHNDIGDCRAGRGQGGQRERGLSGYRQVRRGPAGAGYVVDIDPAPVVHTTLNATGIILFIDKGGEGAGWRSSTTRQPGRAQDRLGRGGWCGAAAAGCDERLCGERAVLERRHGAGGGHGTIKLPGAGAGGGRDLPGPARHRWAADRSGRHETTGYRHGNRGVEVDFGTCCCRSRCLVRAACCWPGVSAASWAAARLAEETIHEGTKDTKKGMGSSPPLLLLCLRALGALREVR